MLLIPTVIICLPDFRTVHAQFDEFRGTNAKLADVGGVGRPEEFCEPARSRRDPENLDGTRIDARQAARHSFRERPHDVGPQGRVLVPMLGLTQLANYLTLKASFSAVSKPNFEVNMRWN